MHLVKSAATLIPHVPRIERSKPSYVRISTAGK